MELQLNKILIGDVLKKLRTLPDKSVHCIVTSPPYWGLRDYGVKGQLGLEKSPEAFVRKMVNVFRQCQRVLKDNGTLWLNIGDSYAATGKSRTKEQAARKSNLKGKGTQISCANQINKISRGYKAKDLIGIPWLLALALRKDGWYLRQDIIWHKPNPMPESVTDRCTKSHEYIFLLTKSPKYYFDAFSIATPYKEKTLTTFGCEVKGKGDGSGLIASENLANSINTLAHNSEDGRLKEAFRRTEKNLQDKGLAVHSMHVNRKNGRSMAEDLGGVANKRTVWTVATKSFPEAHFATFPEDLIVDCIKAGCPENGVVLDPFFGAGTTGLVARKLNRNFIGIELNQKYVAIAEKRLRKELGMFI